MITSVTLHHTTNGILSCPGLLEMLKYPGFAYEIFNNKTVQISESQSDGGSELQETDRQTDGWAARAISGVDWESGRARPTHFTIENLTHSLTQKLVEWSLG